MRNGPCGGTAFGRCEVVDQACIWTAVYARAKAGRRLADLRTYIPPPHRSLQGTSSWINYFLGAGQPPAKLVVTNLPRGRRESLVRRRALTPLYAAQSPHCPGRGAPGGA
jgi:hypothetical protein